MRRLLSQILIIILLLLGPITFTTANIPNFQPDCETGSSQRIKATIRVAVSDQPQRSTPNTRAAIAPQEIIPATIHPPHSNLFFPSCYSRPPPLSFLNA